MPGSTWLVPSDALDCGRYRRNMQCRRSSGTSRARARFIWPGSMESANAFRRAAFLGPRIFRQHGRSRRGRDPRLHSQPREGRPEARTDESLALTNATFRWRRTQGPRQRPAHRARELRATAGFSDRLAASTLEPLDARQRERLIRGWRGGEASQRGSRGGQFPSTEKRGPLGAASKNISTSSRAVRARVQFGEGRVGRRATTEVGAK